MERRQINAPAAKLRGTVAVLKIYRENMDVIKEREGKRTVDDKGGSERNGHSPITAVE